MSATTKPPAARKRREKKQRIIAPPISGQEIVLLVVIAALWVALGLFTRPAALWVAGVMAGAAFVVHQGSFTGADNFGAAEMAVLYLSIALCFLLTGSSRTGLDQLVWLDRPDCGPVNGRQSEQHYEHLRRVAEIEVFNDSTFDNLKDAADAVARLIREGKHGK